MLKKLLKYEFRSYLKLWAIFSSILLSASITTSVVYEISFDSESPIFIISIFMLIFTIAGGSAYLISPFIMSIVRFYKNLFSDEGYLTFTLPIKKTDIINSKIISSSLLFFASLVIYLISMCICSNAMFTSSLLDFTFEFRNFISQGSVWSLIFIIELVASFVILCVLIATVVLLCITFACTITKKARVITAIGIYYGSYVVTIILMIIMSASFASGYEIYTETLPETLHIPMLCLIWLVIMILFSIIFFLLYLAEYRLIDKKLNLA